MAAAAEDTLRFSLCFDNFFNSLPTPVFMRVSAVTSTLFKARSASRLRSVFDLAFAEATREFRLPAIMSAEQIRVQYEADAERVIAQLAGLKAELVRDVKSFLATKL